MCTSDLLCAKRETKKKKKNDKVYLKKKKKHTNKQAGLSYVKEALTALRLVEAHDRGGEKKKKNK